MNGSLMINEIRMGVGILESDIAAKDKQIMELKDQIEKLLFVWGTCEKQIVAMKKYIEVLEYCSDDAEVYHELLDKGVEMKELKKEAGL